MKLSHIAGALTFSLLAVGANAENKNEKVDSAIRNGSVRVDGVLNKRTEAPLPHNIPSKGIAETIDEATWKNVFPDGKRVRTTIYISNISSLPQIGGTKESSFYIGKSMPIEKIPSEKGSVPIIKQGIIGVGVSYKF